MMELTEETKSTAETGGDESQQVVKRSTTQILTGKAKLKRVRKYYDPSELPLQVGLRLSVTEVTHIDTSKQQYGIKGYLVFNWRATKKDVVNYNQSQEDGTKYVPEYTPDLHFVNDVEILSHEEKQNLKIDFNQSKFGDTPFNSQEALFINVIFTQEFDVQSFPFDVQNLPIIITTLLHDRREDIQLVPSLIHQNQFKLDKTCSSIVHWEIANIDVSRTVIEGKSKGSKQYDLVVFRIGVMRKWKGIVYRYIIWLLLLGIMSFAAFTIHPGEDVGERLGYVVTMSLTVIAFQFILENFIPDVNYLTILDKYNLFTFFVVFLITIETSVLAWIEPSVEQATEVDRIYAYSLFGLFVLGNVAFVVYGFVARTKERTKLSNWDVYRSEFLTFISDEKKHLDQKTKINDFKTIKADTKNNKIYS
mmetsp:Transcript_14227/g.21476  ORF Transcript_14227/g.21476 Transcript_14227/m.21476 type:complete len:420 (-) Transcript_14227:272-1531(-)